MDRLPVPRKSEVKASRRIKKDLAVMKFRLVAGRGFEPLTSGLWARRATRLLYPAIYALILYYLLRNIVKKMAIKK